MIHNRVHESPSLVPTLSQINSVHTLPLCFLKNQILCPIFQLLRSLQRIQPNPRPYMTFRDVAFEVRSYWPPSVGYSKLFLQYTRRYLRIWRPSPASARCGASQALVTRDPIKLFFSHFLILICIDIERRRKTELIALKNCFIQNLTIRLIYSATWTE
jgi:hypothetical protein